MNKDKIIKKVMDWFDKEYSGVHNEVRHSKCVRDTGYNYDAIMYDLENNGIKKTIEVAKKYWAGTKSQLGPNEQSYAVAVNKKLGEVLSQVVPEEQVGRVGRLINNINDIMEYGAPQGDLVEFTSERHQTKRWSDKVPEHTLIESILKKTYELVPSKQSLIPYKVVVLGPENPEKEEFRKFTVDGNRGQPAVELRSPYVLLFTEREIDNVSPSISKKIKRGHPYTILKIGNDKHDKCIEIGMFSTILTELCLFHGLSTAFTLCFPLRNNPGWEKFKHILPSHPLLVMSIGYSNQKKSSVEDNEEYKPVIEDVIQWT